MKMKVIYGLHCISVFVLCEFCYLEHSKSVALVKKEAKLNENWSFFSLECSCVAVGVISRIIQCC